MDARSYAREVVERLRDRGVLVGVTGPGADVLKIRPPLVWTTQHADLFAERLGEVLA
jgi:4-aminobutyrate aminotransferase-like enzyme